ncbi:DUF4956 domain-containing protein [Streptococcus hyovaginalis]|uniref:DUF4956 domain-containing protein n=1 Tax=Streptococcus hyovaginalis TaxID=149015 RepID=UPI00041B4064|nr:DUF4956 domain-containing protein [Streptococcus hyovaginalis]
MVDLLFNNTFSQTSTTVSSVSFIGIILISFILGLALAKCYAHQTFYTKEFLITLSLLPSLITLLIFLVNGNLGTGIAVAGTFSLVRFRSAAGGVRELLAIFMAMVMGLALGMGYAVLTIAFTLLFLLMWFSYDHSHYFSASSAKRHLTVILANKSDQIEALQKWLNDLCQTVDIISIDNQKNPETIQINYEITLNQEISDLRLIQSLAHQIENANFKLSKKIKKRKTL